MMLDLAQHYDKGPVPIRDIAKRQGISLKYLEQISIPLRKNNYTKSFRGSKGGYTLAKSAEEITIGEIVNLLEDGVDVTECVGNPDICNRASRCLMREVWIEVTKIIQDKLNSITLSEIIKTSKNNNLE
jgi:Rrf2 family protein